MKKIGKILLICGIITIIGTAGADEYMINAYGTCMSDMQFWNQFILGLLMIGLGAIFEWGFSK